MPQRIQLTEAGAMGASTDTITGSGRMKVVLISSGVGSSGAYLPAVLEAAAKAKVFKAGLHMHLDHVGEAEAYDRRNVGRSVRDVAAVTTTDATWDASLSALVAETQVFTPYRDVIAEMKDDIGISIVASAMVEPGEYEGVQMPIITELIEGLAADYVSAAGRGGKILQVLESAKTAAETAFTPAASLTLLAESRNVGQWIESRMHLDFTRNADEMFGDGRLSREERIALSGAVGAALDAFATDLAASAPQLYTRDLWEDPQVIAAAIEAALIVPVIPAGPPKEKTMPQIEEARLSQLEADSSRVPVLEAERDSAIAERDTARTERAASVARDTARPIATTMVGESTSLPPVVAARVIEAAVAGVTLGADGAFDEAAFRVAVEAARTAAETEVASIAEAFGVGKVTAFGHNTTNQGDVVAEAEKAAAAAFGRQSKEA